MSAEFWIQFGQYLISDDFFIIIATISVWGFFISGIDDLFIDLYYVFALAFKDRHVAPLHIKDIEALDEKPIAVMIPAWQEGNIIRKMLMRNVANIDYLNYHLFLGTYPNDAETQREVDAVIAYYNRIREGMYTEGLGELSQNFIHKIVTPRPGPTNKADNLNTVYRTIKVIEKDLIQKGELNKPFEIFVMHDSEDVIHPKEFKLFNYLMTNKPEKDRAKDSTRKEKFDFVQTPVFPLEVSIMPSAGQTNTLKESLAKFKIYNPITWVQEISIIFFEFIRVCLLWFNNVLRYSVSATYMDEFAEHHTKDMLVRRSIKGLVPSAGVGTGINRMYLGELEKLHDQGDVFNDAHLTEDYLISLQLKNLGAKQFFVVEPITMLKYKDGNIDVTHEVDEFIATKEYFPDTIMSAVKQKARWVMGITYQTIFPESKDEHLTDLTRGQDFKTKYTLMRDRKSLVTNYINILGYILFIYCVVKITLVYTIGYDWKYSNIFPPNSYIWWLVLFDMVIMVERYLQRIHAVNKVYGFKHAFYFLLRTVFLIGLFLGNIINFLATLGATRRYMKYVISKYSKRDEQDEDEQEKADKPDDKIGDQKDSDNKPVKTANKRNKTAVPAWGKTDHDYLTDEQMREYVNRIGELALRTRLLKPAQLKKALGMQKGERKKLGEILKIMGLIDDVGFSMLYAQHLSIPLPDEEIDPTDIDPAVLRLLSEDVAIRFGIVPIKFDADGRLVVASSEPMLVDEQKELESILDRNVRPVLTYQSDLDFSRRRAYGHRVSSSSSSQPRIGDALVDQGLITESQLEEALQRQKQLRQPLGEVLLEIGAIKEDVLNVYFRESLGISFKRLHEDQVDLSLFEKFPKAFCQIHRVVPYKTQDGSILLAISNIARLGLVDMIKAQQNEDVIPFIAPEKDIIKIIEYCSSHIDAERVKNQLLGNLLINEGVISENHLKEALKQSASLSKQWHDRDASGLSQIEKHPPRIGEVLIKYGYCSETDFLTVYSKELYLNFVKLNGSIEYGALKNVYPHVEAKEHSIVPIKRGKKSLTFALPYDFSPESIRSFEDRFPQIRLHYVLALKKEIKNTISKLYSNLD